MSPAGRYFTWALWIACLGPPLWIASRVIRVGVNVPFYDEWYPGSSVDIALRAVTGHLHIRDLFAQNFEHRILFTHLTTALLAATGQWNLKAEMLLSVGLAFATWLTLVSLVPGQKSLPRAALALVLSALVFSARQQNNWLWGFQTQWYFCLFFLAGGVWLLCRGPRGGYTVAAAGLACAAASFSFGSGLLGWPILLGVGIGVGYRRWRHALPFCVIGALALAVFFHDYHLPPFEHVPRSLAAVGRFLVFAQTFLGGALVPKEASMVPVAIIAGDLCLAALIVNVVGLRRRDVAWSQLAPWLGLAAHAVGSAALVSHGHRARQFEDALHGRFTASSAMLPAAAAVLSVLALCSLPPNSTKARILRVSNYLLFVVIAVMTVFSTLRSLTPPPFVGTQSQRDCVVRFPATRDATCLGIVSDNTTGISGLIDLLALKRLASFSVAVPPAAPVPLARSAEDFVFDLESDEAWAANNLWRYGPRRWRIGDAPSMTYRKPLRECMGDYSHIVIGAAVPPDAGARLLDMWYGLESVGGTVQEYSSLVQLVPGGEMIEYVVDLRAIDLPRSARLISFRVDPVRGPGPGGENHVEIGELRLAYGGARGSCGETSR